MTDVIEFRLTGVNDEMCVVSVLNDLVDDCDRSWVASVNDVRLRRGDQPQIVSSLHLYEGNKVLHSVCPSVPCLWRTRDQNAVVTSNLLETYCRTRVTGIE